MLRSALTAAKRPAGVIARRFQSNLPATGSAATAVKEATSQAPNRATVWSENQRDRASTLDNARFEQTDLDKQPRPMAAIELISAVPVIKVDKRIAVCDGGGGALGHPKVYINLDDGHAQSCGYCGLRFQQEPHHH
ncbi:zinc-finger domain-containing protein [Thamnocephalis sphaerospora]|uniref:Zinc-finger domain-containing protein n=1 Tax=Thamnocephalis sphaerospora TaxID=78915 RepID=A0A4V1IW07_9FUNG|nr:zinc-finger domain-containing protein [Thamnocephalis sphaerospora]|eukprot:RKP05899.1 zinc-finger domain-containing protein [Thamnocephalis sphaerospora]